VAGSGGVEIDEQQDNHQDKDKMEGDVQ